MASLPRLCMAVHVQAWMRPVIAVAVQQSNNHVHDWATLDGCHLSLACGCLQGQHEYARDATINAACAAQLEGPGHAQLA